MASVAFFVRFVALMLLVVSIVYCDWVGHGKHELVNGKIVKLRGNTKIAEKPEDLELYKNMPGSCDVEMDNENITIWYLKHSKTTKEGCSIDFAVPDPTIIKGKYDLLMHFGIQHNKELNDCLANFIYFGKVSLYNYSAITTNLLSFSFSLKNGEFDGVKRGYPERHKNYCGDLSKCHNKGGKCLDVTDYTVGWARALKYIRSIIYPIGETELELVEASCSPITEHKHETEIHYYFDGMGFRLFCEESPKTYSCFKQENVRRPERWEIKDEDYTDTLYNHLYTFHILPTTSMQMSMQNIWMKCDEDANKENCNENAAFQQCDKMYIKFPRLLYKVLVPDNSVKQTTTEETTTMATCPPVVNCPPIVECPDVVSCQTAVSCPTVASCPTIPECQPCGTECPEIDCPDVDCPSVATNIIQPGNSTEKVEIKPQNGHSLPSPTVDCYNEGTKKDSKKTLQITLVIVGSIILLLMFTALLICLFVSKSK